MKKLLSLMVAIVLVISMLPAAVLAATSTASYSITEMASYGWDDETFTPNLSDPLALGMATSYVDGKNGKALKVQQGTTPSDAGAYIDLTASVLKGALINEKAIVHFKLDVYPSDDYAGVGVEVRCNGDSTNAWDGAANPWKLYAGESLTKEKWHTVEYVFDTINKVYYNYIDEKLHQPATAYTIPGRETGLSLLRLRFPHYNKKAEDKTAPLSDSYVLIDNMEVKREHPAPELSLVSYKIADETVEFKDASLIAGATEMNLNLSDLITGLDASKISVKDSDNNSVNASISISNTKINIAFPEGIAAGKYTVNIDNAGLTYNKLALDVPYSLPFEAKEMYFGILSPKDGTKYNADEDITVCVSNKDMINIGLYVNETLVEEKEVTDGIYNFTISEPVYGVNSIKVVGTDANGRKLTRRIEAVSYSKEKVVTSYSHGTYTNFNVTIPNKTQSYFTFTKKEGAETTAVAGDMLNVEGKYSETGVFVKESRVMVDNLDSAVKYIYRASDGTWGTVVVFNNGKLGNTGLTYEAKKWYDVKIVNDIPNNKQTYYISGENYGPYALEYKLSDFVGSIVREKIHITIGASATLTDAIYFEHVSHYSEKETLPVVNKVTAYSADAETETVKGVVDLDTVSIGVKFSDVAFASLDEEYVKLYKGNQEVVLLSVAVTEENEILLYPANKLSEGDYQIKVLNGAALASGNSIDRDIIIPIKATNTTGVFSDGIEFSVSGAKATSYIPYNNATGAKVTGKVIIAAYEGDKLVNISASNASINVGEGYISYGLNDIKTATRLKAMLWLNSNMDVIVPFAEINIK
ncbi:MAG: hypothetical protein IJC74_06155 [Clostridia bacterium]|nr:hypothetical protein [Clostridia bacterium]